MEELVQISKILSDINRVKMIALMQRDKELCVCEFCDTLELSQPLVSRHLKQMKELGIVNVKKSGKWSIYSLVSNKYIDGILSMIEEDTLKLKNIVSCYTKI